jgi:putative nucleotidyltransferase with HDIG domain
MSASHTTIDVEELRVGMYIHLDGGWMSHPFPLSSFRISDPDQIRTIRRLGLHRLRWSPDRSAAPPTEPAPLGDTATVVDAANTPAATGVPPAEQLERPEPPEPPEQAERRQRREALNAQRTALSRCERQYTEASRIWRRASDLVCADPSGARELTETLSRTLVSKMLGEHELCVRLLTSTAGERAAGHALNVGVISLLMGRLFGLSESEMLDLGTGALLHDIGKIDLPDRVRFPDDSFTQAEIAMYRDHVSHGVSHGRKMGLEPGALLVIAQHHEQADGSGFPQRLNVDRMTAAARIVSLVNRYDNLCNPTVAVRAITPHEALSLMFAQGKHKFDATMLSAFIRMMGVYPPGSAVQLTDDRYALVVTVNSTRPLKPRVLVHDPKVPRDEALYLDLEAAPGLGIRRSLRTSQLPPASQDYLAPGHRIAYFFETTDPASHDHTLDG